MAALMTEGGEPDGWDRSLLRIQRYMNNSERKVTSKTPFELLHGYRPRFLLGKLRVISKTVDEWMMPEELWQEAREQIERAKLRTKSAFDKHRHDNTSYSVGEVVVMKRCPTATGESTKLLGDVYRVVELNKYKKSRFATTAHVIQHKSWKFYEDEENELEVKQGNDESEVNQEDELEVNQDEEGEVEPRESTVEVLGRPIRKRHPPD